MGRGVTRATINLVEKGGKTSEKGSWGGCRRSGCCMIKGFVNCVTGASFCTCLF